MFFRQLVVMVSLFCLTGCGLIDYFFLPPPEDTAQDLFENANDAMRDKKYSAAVDYYNNLKENYPFSPYTLDAELSLGDALFLDERYLEAVEAYKEFEALHPRHEAIPYVLYQIGTAGVKSFVSIDRPTTMVQEAIDYFNRLQEMYPDTEYAMKAAGEIRGARKTLAEHELYLADVFWNMEDYGPAWRRYTYIVDNFSDVPDIQKHAQEKALAAYYKFQAAQAKQEQEKVSGSWKSMFKWL